MQAKLNIECGQCRKHLGSVKVDTADMPEELQAKINAIILKHRDDCPYYGRRAD